MTRGAIGIALSATVLIGCNPGSPARVDWEDPEVFARNREPARSFFIPYADRAAALTGDPNLSPFVLLLNGFGPTHLLYSLPLLPILIKYAHPVPS